MADRKLANVTAAAEFVVAEKEKSQGHQRNKLGHFGEQVITCTKLRVK